MVSFTEKFWKENVLLEWWILFWKNLAITWQYPLFPKVDRSPIRGKGDFLPKNSLTIVPKTEETEGMEKIYTSQSVSVLVMTNLQENSLFDSLIQNLEQCTSNKLPEKYT